MNRRLHNSVNFPWAAIAKVSLAIFFSPCLIGQNLHYLRYTTEDGLAHDIGYSITQDAEGYVWIGTDDGLSRFDGEAFVNYTSRDGLNSPYVITLAEDQEGRLWLGNYRQKISYFQGGEFHEVPDSLAGQLQNVIPLANGNHILFRSQAGLAVNKCFYVFDSLPRFKGGRKLALLEKDGKLQLSAMPVMFDMAQVEALPIYSVLANDTSEVWLGAGAGLVKGAFREGRLQLEGHYLPGTIVYGAVGDGNGGFFLTTKNEVLHWKEGKLLRRITTGVERPRFLVRTGPNRLYFLSGDRAKLWQADMYTGRVADIKPRLGIHSSISTIYADRFNNLWVTTMGDGLYCVFETVFQNFHTSDGLDNPYVRFIVRSPDGTPWAGTLDGLYYLRNENWRLFPLYEKGAGDILVNEITSLVVNQDGHLQCSSQYNNYLIDEEQAVRCNKYVSSKIWFPGRGGRLMAFSNHGLRMGYKCREDSLAQVSGWHVLPEGHSWGYPNHSIQDGRGRVWVATDVGLYLFLEGEFHALATQMEEASLNTNYLAEGPDSCLWVANTEGLYRLEETRPGRFRFAGPAVSGNIKTFLFSDTDELWAGTSEGLALYRPGSGAIRRFSKGAGLAANGVNCLYLDNRRKLWIGTNNGISVLDLNAPLPVPSLPVVAIQEVRLNGKAAQDRRLGQLPNRARIEVDYTAIQRPNIKNVQFSYRLQEGGSWVSTIDRSLSFSDLRPGRYRLEIRARTAESDWAAPALVAFSIASPWWMRWWAVALCLLAGGAVTWGIALRRMKKLRERSALERRAARLELDALRAQMDPHFVFNSLNAIQNFIVREEPYAANLYLARFARLMRLYLESTKKPNISLAEELELLNLYMELEKLRFEERFDYQVELSTKANPSDIMVPTMLFQPFVENAINHGLMYKKGKGKLQLRFCQKGDILIAVITDNGVGREKAKALRQRDNPGHRSRGLQLVKERLEAIEQLNGQQVRIEIADQYGDAGAISGTRVEIRIKL